MNAWQGNIQLRYIRSKEEQLRILRACHCDATSGHLGLKKTLARITERFSWYGMTKDVEDMVRCIMSNARMHVAIAVIQLHSAIAILLCKL